ncbi:hypothetical protein EWM64_g7060 [Hericium alpestre]|uniref:Uncharacterized protein n=1 Tax=Hericium alpestre TaxID=135208 RepID=A0A4Y9ZQ95_9AGAM|nr:hypothetical protein EWM64_g7060 [Hericium alpestre]
MLTARFLLHLRAWDSKPVVGSVSRTMHDAEGTMPTFQAAQRAMTSIVDEFGSDPMQNAAESEDRDSEGHELSEIAVEDRGSSEA